MPEPSASSPATQQTHSAVFIAAAGLIALAVAMGVGRFAFTPLLPMMQADAGVSVTAGGWLASANYVGYLLGALSAVWLRVPMGLMVLGGLVIITLVTAAMGLSIDFATWLILRLLAGIMSAWVLIFGSAWCLERLALLHRPVLNGVVFAGVGTGIAVAGVLCLALMQFGVGSARAWILLGGLSLAATLAVWPVFTGTESSATHAPRRPAPRKLRWSGDAVRLSLCYGVFGFGYIIPATFLPVMAKQVIPDPALFGWAWPVFGTAALLSTLAAAARPQTISHRGLWSACHLVMALGVMLPVIWSGITAILLAALLVGSTFMVVTMAAIQEAREVGGAQATGLVAAMTAAFALGQIVGPIVAGTVVEFSGDFNPALLAASALLVISAGALARRPAA
jgi:predicted MFS family arabinose efflux permease